MPATYDEVETLVQSRRLADEIYRELEATQPRWMPHASSPPPLPPTIEPDEFVPPPSLPPSNIYDSAWSTTLPVAGAPALLRKPHAHAHAHARRSKRKRKVRTHLHWAVLAMAVAITLGLWRDHVARANAKRAFVAESQRVMKVVKVTAVSAQARARVVSARII